MLALVESVDAAPRLIPPNAVSTKPKAEEGPAMLFLKHAFDDIVHGIDESIRTVPGGSAYRGFLLESGVWTREHWERAVELGAGDLSSCSYLIDDHGIWLRPRFAWDNQHDHFTWHPQAERENGEDPRQSAILPFPFNGRHLAACWLGPPGSDIFERMVACIKDADGNIAAAAMLMAPDPNSVAARRALQAAWAAWQGAKALVGRDDTDVDVPRAQAEHQAAKARAMGRFKWREPGISEQEKDRRRQQYNAAMEAPNAKLTKVRRKADAAHRAWRKEMVRHLLLVPDQEDPIVASIAEAGGDGPGETIVERQRRRLDRFRFFGGRMKKAGNTWHCTGGRRGALADLAVEEKEAGRPMSHRTNVADDLRAATEAENKASEDIRRS